MLLVLLVYLVSAVSWGAILYQLSKVVIATHKRKIARPPLLVPLAIASLALFIESVYFGSSAYFKMVGNEAMFNASLEESNWFLIKLLIAISGVLLLFNLKIEEK